MNCETLPDYSPEELRELRHAMRRHHWRRFFQLAESDEKFAHYHLTLARSVRLPKQERECNDTN